MMKHSSVRHMNEVLQRIRANVLGQIQITPPPPISLSYYELSPEKAIIRTIFSKYTFGVKVVLHM